jgi:hypothetical protein
MQFIFSIQVVYIAINIDTDPRKATVEVIIYE